MGPFVFSPIKDFCKDRQKETAKRKYKNHQGGDIKGQVFQSRFQPDFFLCCPCLARVPSFHEKLHKMIDVTSFIQEEIPIFFKLTPEK